jgi:hypothetical protein
LLVIALLLGATDALMFSDGAKRAPRTEAKMTKTAKRFLAALTRNVDAWYADQIDYETFGERQRATWDAIHAAGPAVEETVLRPLREQLPPVAGGRR